MIWKKSRIAAIFFAGTLVLGGCGSKADNTGDGAKEADTGSQYVEASTDDEGNIVIDTAEIGEDASFINCDVDGVNVQLIAVKGSDGTVRLAYNTCQICTPSPRAYFVQEGDVFTCQNCGNQFDRDEIGESAAGCNPTTVDGVSEEGDTITIEKSAVEKEAANFENWAGPVS